MTSELHEKTLKNFIEELRKEGYKVFDLERKIPDAIAMKNGEIYAVEVLGVQYKQGKGWTKKWTYRSKTSNYHMFDGVIFKTFKHPQKR